METPRQNPEAVGGEHSILAETLTKMKRSELDELAVEVGIAEAPAKRRKRLIALILSLGGRGGQ